MADPEERRKKQARFQQWEKLGLDQVKHDLLNGGYRVVGGSPQVRKLAWEWVRIKEAEQAKTAQKTDEILTLKPSLWGIGMNLKELWRQIRRRLKKP